jgi:hypothetical protein
MCCMCTFPGQREEVSRARRLVARYLDGSPVTDDAVLLVSELAANACAHSASGRPGGGLRCGCAATSRTACTWKSGMVAAVGRDGQGQ